MLKWGLYILFWQKTYGRSIWRSSATIITRPVSRATCPRPPPLVPLQDCPCLHPRPCMHWFLDFSYCSFHADSESNECKICTLSALLTMWVFWHLRKFWTQYNSLASCYKKRKLTDCKTPPTPVLFFKWRIGFLVRLEIMCWKKQIFFPPAGKERDITHFYAASMAKGKKSVNLFFSLITRGEVENQYRSDKNVITW